MSLNKTLVNREPIEVEHLDGSRETITLRRLSLEEIYTFLELLDRDRPEEVVLLATGKDRAWLEDLTDESGAEISKLALAENFRRAVIWSRGSPVIARRLLPTIRQLREFGEMVKELEEQTGAITSNLSPTSAASPDGAGNTPSASPSSDSMPSSTPSITPATATDSAT